MQIPDVIPGLYEVVKFVDRNRVSITQSVWSALRDDPDYAKIAHSHIAEFCVSTVWLGLDGAIKMPFETAVFDNYAGGVIRMGLYRDEGQAISGHLSACTAVRMSCLELLPAR